MTREDAAKHFESYIGNECYTDFHQDACQMAIAALRSQQTPAKLDRSRWKGCEWCREFGAVPLRGFTVHGCTSTTAHFCPNCGKPLTEEAWAKLKRMIGGNDETTD